MVIAFSTESIATNRLSWLRLWLKLLHRVKVSW
jgi:hypothetical protein